jgi:spermidine/putrescine transport system ATP-binding protein
MQFELKRIQREVGISFVYVTHDQGEALTMSDRIAVMHDGKVEHLGTPEEVYLRPATLFVAGFIGQASLLPCRVETGGASTVDVVVEDGTRVAATRAGDGCLPGSDAMLVIRPEHMRLSTGRPDGNIPAISVTVAEEVFQGSVVRYQLDGPAGVRLTATVPLEERADVHPGSAAWARWLPDWGYVLPVRATDAAVVDAPAEGAGAAEHA